MTKTATTQDYIDMLECHIGTNGVVDTDTLALFMQEVYEGEDCDFEDEIEAVYQKLDRAGRICN